jgi:hypothetical protein
MPRAYHRQPDPIANAGEVRTNTPQWEKDFPFIRHNDVDPEMRKELWKSIPKTSEWDKFSGELPHNHELWLKNIDVFVEDYCMLDHMVVSRLTALFTDTAKNWYIGIREIHGRNPGLGGKIPYVINLAPTTGNGKCSKNLRRTFLHLKIRKCINGLTLKEKGSELSNQNSVSS